MAAKKSRRAPAKERNFEFWRWGLWLLILLPPLAISLSAKDNFRLPKLLVSEILAVLCVLLLLPRLRQIERIDWRTFFARPVVRAMGPILLIASATLLVTSQPLHGREALLSLWIAGVLWIGVSLALDENDFERLWTPWIAAAVVLALLALVQKFFFNPFQYEGQVNQRVGLTSLAGGPFDLSGYLVLPALVLQQRLCLGTEAKRRWILGGLLALLVGVIALTQTLTAILAVGLGSLIFWARLLPRRQLMAGAAIAIVLGAGLAIGFEPLRNRIGRKAEDLRQGQFNEVLTGRLDGWRSAVWMWRESPLLGVGHGAYRTRFGDAKLALLKDGQEFTRQLREPYFTHAHSEPLHVLAEWGSLGFLALIWAIAMIFRGASRRARDLLEADRPADAALIWAALVAISIMASINFPFHLAVIAYPTLLFLGWILAPVPKEA